jgi:hypothetical protein
MTSLRTRLSQLRSTNEGGEFTLISTAVSMILFGIVFVITLPTISTAQQAQVTFGVKSDVVTTAALISSNLASRFYSEPVDIQIRTEGCEGETILMSSIPVSVASSTCVTAIGNQDRYIVTGTTHSNGEVVSYVSDSQSVSMNTFPEGE